MIRETGVRLRELRSNDYAPCSIRKMSALAGMLAGSSTFWALSAPATGNDPASSSPTWARTEAWSQ